ncbi:hypothetical protein BD770DRAFT_398763, partial [Pilaira anomala]
ADEDSSDDDDNEWRDPDMLAGVTLAASAVNNIRTKGFQQQQQQQQQQRPAYVDTTILSNTGHRNPHCYPRDIQKLTGSFTEFNERLNQIDIWGDTEAIDKTKSYLDRTVSRLAEKDTSTCRKTRKWGRPERELTPKEKRWTERKQARLDEEKRYQGLPPMEQNYHGLLGDSESYLNQIRADCKAFLWYEPSNHVIRVAADTSDAMNTAAKRIRNWYVRCKRKPEGGLARLLQQPSQDYLIAYRNLPTEFVTYQYTDPEREKIMLEKHRLLEAVETALSGAASTLNERNREVIEHLFERGLESMRLNDWNLRLKIRFGQIYLIDYPKEDKYMTIGSVSDKIFRKKQFKSALAPCISKTKEGLDLLFGYTYGFSQKYATEFSDNSRTSFSIKAKQYPTAPPKILDQHSPPRGDMWDTLTEISFTDDGQRRLWSTMTNCNDLVDISCADIENSYSWDLKLQHARRLPNDDINSPHEKFAHALSVSSNNRLVLATSDDHIPKISWNDYVVEICNDEIWNMKRIERTDRELPMDLTSISSHPPSWTLSGFLALNNEDVSTLMSTVKNFSEILSSEVPLYWENAGRSLV